MRPLHTGSPSSCTGCCRKNHRITSAHAAEMVRYRDRRGVHHRAHLPMLSMNASDGDDIEYVMTAC
jgi:hypothetical protein